MGNKGHTFIKSSAAVVVVLVRMGGFPAYGSPTFTLPFVSDRHRSIKPASLKWQADGELSPQDVFNLICRLRSVEPGETSNELWRLGQKYPSRGPQQA